MSYTFATDGSATDRLRAIAEVFNPHAAEFVSLYAPTNPATVVDLGCGPGFSTAMLRDVLPSARLIGLDNARHSLDRARRAMPGASFVDCDLTQPLPVVADMMYARFLLSHLADPVGRVNGWLVSINPGGRLLIDECNAIHPGDEALATYLDITKGLIASTGGRLFVGPSLSAGTYAGGVELDRVDVIHIPNATAASWFIHNVEHVWPHSPYVCERIDEPARLSLLERLKSLSNERAGYSVWYMRRMVLTREMPHGQ